MNRADRDAATSGLKVEQRVDAAGWKNHHSQPAASTPTRDTASESLVGHQRAARLLGIHPIGVRDAVAAGHLPDNVTERLITDLLVNLPPWLVEQHLQLVEFHAARLQQEAARRQQVAQSSGHYDAQVISDILGVTRQQAQALVFARRERPADDTLSDDQLAALTSLTPVELADAVAQSTTQTLARPKTLQPAEPRAASFERPQYTNRKYGRKAAKQERQRVKSPCSLPEAAVHLGLSASDVALLVMALHNNLQARHLTIGQVEQWQMLAQRQLATALERAKATVIRLSAEAEQRIVHARRAMPLPVRDAAMQLGIRQKDVRNLAITLGNDPRLTVLTTGQIEDLLQLSTPKRAARVAWATAVATPLRAEWLAHQRLAREQRRVAHEQERARRAALVQLRAEHGIESTHVNPAEVRVAAAAAYLGLSTAQIRRLMEKQLIPATSRRVYGSYGVQLRWFCDLERLVVLKADPPEWLTKSQERATRSVSAQREIQAFQAHESWQPRRERERASLAEAKRVHEERVQVAMSRVELAFPRRRQAADVAIRIGPTNSGKTYAALQELAVLGAGVYAAPLRFLAREARDRLATQLGEDRVGLMTGEERDQEDAPILCVTAEMAPLRGAFLVLDETHWAADPDRGSAWARLLRFGDYGHIRLLGAPDALPLIMSAFPHATVVFHERLGVLRYIGAVMPQQITPGTAIVAFSRKATLGLGAALSKAGRRAAVLYGAMPVEARRRELARFASGEVDILCTTDVVGHGVNVPSLQTVLFAETQKFDGSVRRRLERWEVAQIAGRAGRFGLTEDGQVGVLAGYPWFTPDEALIRSALTPTMQITDTIVGYRRIEHTRLRPRLDELGCEHAADLGVHVEAWRRLASERITEPWLRIDGCQNLLAWFTRLVNTPRRLEKLNVQDAWTLMRIPADLEKHALLFDHIVQAVTDPAPDRRLRVDYTANEIATLDLEQAEERASEIAVLRWFANAFPQHCPFTAADAGAAELLVGGYVARTDHITAPAYVHWSMLVMWPTVSTVVPTLCQLSPNFARGLGRRRVGG